MNQKVTFRRHLFAPRGSSHATLKYRKIGTKLGYYIRIADYYYLWITVVNFIEDCLKMLILRLCFCFLRLRLAVCELFYLFVGLHSTLNCTLTMNWANSILFEFVAPVSNLCLANRRPCFWFVWKNRFLTQALWFFSGIAVNIRKLLTSNRHSEQHFGFRCFLWPSASWLKLPRTTCELGEQYRYHLARSVEQIEIAFPYTISTSLHIFHFYAGASRLLLIAGAIKKKDQNALRERCS